MGVLARIARPLAAQGALVYLAGLGVIAGVRYRRAPFAVVDAGAVPAVVAGALSAMTATYLAELAVRNDAFEADVAHPSWARLLVLAGPVGAAVAGFLLATGSALAAAPVLFGGVLAGRAGVRRPLEGDDGSGGPESTEPEGGPRDPRFAGRSDRRDESTGRDESTRRDRLEE
ncbi:MAG: hypothetical protein V5A23_04000 [Halobacteriales archaeon]